MAPPGLPRPPVDDRDNRYRHLIQTGIALSAERNHKRLIEMILLEAKEMSRAEGGTVYLLTEDGSHYGEPIADDNPWGFKIKPTAARSNLGELYNLSIRTGTLTPEDRYSINDHIVQTVIMLEALPFPQALRRVPEWAANHHEKMDGTGYPRGLRLDEMSIPARMMAIADIFEALTAGDRPYKPPKPLSEAIGIMVAMARNQHIDCDLLALFLSAGVHLSYAQKFLSPDQIDEVDISRHLAELGKLQARERW